MRLAFLCLGLMAWAQQAPSGFAWDKLHPFFGMGLDLIDIRFLGQSLFSYPAEFWGVGGGVHYIYYRDANDFFSIGPAAQISGAFQFLGSFGSNWMLQAPVYGFARIGAAATPYNQQRLGAGVGLGLRLTTFQTLYTTGNYVGKLRQTFVNPTAIFDLTLNFRRTNPTTLRFYMDILPARRNTDVYGSFDPVPLEYRSIGFGLYYFLNQ